jgi:hypothetical protein
MRSKGGNGRSGREAESKDAWQSGKRKTPIRQCGLTLIKAKARNRRVKGMKESTMYEKLEKEVKYAKSGGIPMHLLYQVHGKIIMAHELGAITTEEYLRLDSMAVYDGINNPKYFTQNVLKAVREV